MSLPEKQLLMHEIASLPDECFGEVLDFVQRLKQKTRPVIKSGHSLLALQGLGQELWQPVDIASYLDDERNV